MKNNFVMKNVHVNMFSICMHTLYHGHFHENSFVKKNVVNMFSMICRVKY